MSAICRDPEGCSRIPKETFKNVFERMETDLVGRQFGFSTVIEYFTKRGRPMTKQEQAKLLEEDVLAVEAAHEGPRTQETEDGSREAEDDQVGSPLRQTHCEPRSHSAKPISSKLTIPQPFEFDTRDKTKPKSIRELRID